MAIPLIYRLFFLYIEPISTIVGFYFAWHQPKYYLQETHRPSSALTVPVGTEVALRQLGNLYLAFTLNEALVLRATNDLKVWRTLLAGLLVADLGHVLACAPLGVEYFWDVMSWNPMAWGNIGFVYCGATLRTCFLLGVGLSETGTRTGKVSKKRGKGRR